MVPDGESIKTMFLYDYKGTNVTTTKISEHVHSLTVHLDQESENYSDVICDTTKGNINGASFHASCKDDVAFEIVVSQIDLVNKWFSFKCASVFPGICHKLRSS